MKIWMSGEVEADVAEQYREVRKELEHALNSVFNVNDYGPGLVQWDFIAMIFGPNSPQHFQEVKRYNKREKTAEFRLLIDHDAFKVGPAASRAALLCEALNRSLSLMESMLIPDVDLLAIRRDLLATAKERAWLA